MLIMAAPWMTIGRLPAYVFVYEGTVDTVARVEVKEDGFPLERSY